MEATGLRKELLNYIDKADEKLLKEVKALVENYENDQIIAYTVQGKPLNREAMQQEIAEAESDYEHGDYTTQEQLKEQIKKWKE